MSNGEEHQECNLSRGPEGKFTARWLGLKFSWKDGLFTLAVVPEGHSSEAESGNYLSHIVGEGKSLTFPVCLGIQGPSKIPIALLLVGVFHWESYCSSGYFEKEQKGNFSVTI